MCKEPIMTVEEYKETIIRSIDIGINTTDSDDEYSMGLRNGMRYCKALVDGDEPNYE